MELEWSARHGLWHKPGTDHLDMVYQARREWRYILQTLQPGDRVLDLGAHIGGFSTMVKGLPPWALWCIEPAPDTFSVLQKNCPNATLVQAAVVNEVNGSTDIQLYLSKNHMTSGSAAPSVVAFRGRSPITVKTVKWTDLLDVVQPTVVKCDIESTELFLDWKLLPDCVRAVGMELHYSRPEFKDMANRVIETLSGLGFAPVAGRYNTGNKYPSSNFVVARP